VQRRYERGRTLELEAELARVRQWGRTRVLNLDEELDCLELRIAQFVVEVGEREAENSAARDQACLEAAHLSQTLAESQREAQEMREAREWVKVR